MVNVFPQEIEVWYVLPALRKGLAIAMKDKGLSQRETAKKLGITEAAVSQYFKKKRANEIAFNKKIKEEINNSAKRIIEKDNLMEEMEKLSRLIRKEKVLCDIHRKFCKIPVRCTICQ